MTDILVRICVGACGLISILLGSSFLCRYHAGITVLPDLREKAITLVLSTLGLITILRALGVL